MFVFFFVDGVVFWYVVGYEAFLMFFGILVVGCGYGIEVGRGGVGGG